MSDVLRPQFGQQTDTKGYGRHCSHKSYVVDEDQRQVECATCKKILDPYDVCLAYARGERDFRYWRGEADKAQKAVHEAKEEERKVKARTKSHSRKDAQAAIDDERRKFRQRQARVIVAAGEIRELAEKVRRLSTLSEEP